MGVGEVALAQARLSAAAGNDAAATAAAARSWQAYCGALTRPAELGSVAERLEVQYNCACAGARCGKEAEAVKLLQEVISAGGATLAEVATDADLAGLRPYLVNA